MTDILFCSLPYTNLDYIYSAPAILKGVVIANGYQAHTRDLGVELFEFCNSNLEQFYHVQQYFLTDDSEHTELVDEFYKKFTDSIKNNPPRYIGFSVLSFHTHTAVWEIVQKIREANIDTKIVVGGRGLESNFSSHRYFRTLIGKEKIMRLSKIEKNAFKKINLELNDMINDSSLEKFNKFFEEDCENRLEKIDKLIKLLLQEKALINCIES